MATIGKHRKIIFSEQEIKFIKDNFSKMNNKQISEALGLKISIIRRKCYEMGLKHIELEYWTPEMINYLKANFRRIGDTELAEIYNKKFPKKKPWHKKHFEKKRRYLKLKRTPLNLRKILDREVKKGTYKKAIRKTKATIGENPLFTKVIWKTSGGYKRVFIKLHNGYSSYAHYVYKNEYGFIPKNKVLRHIDGNTLNCNINNLILLNRKENGFLNSKMRNFKNLSPKNHAYVLLSILKKIEIKDIDHHERLLFSLELGFQSIVEASIQLGPLKFNNNFKNRKNKTVCLKK